MKKLLIVLVLLVLVAGGVVAFLAGNLDEIVRRAMESVGSDATVTDVEVETVEIGLTDGSGRIAGVSVGSPEGFEAPHSIQLENAQVSIDTSTLGSDVVVIREIDVSGPDVIYEMSTPGNGNLDTIQKNIDAYVQALGGGSGSGGGDAPPSEDAGGGQKLIIERLAFGGGKLTARASFLKQEASVDLPPFEMRDLGKAQGGATGAEIGAEVLRRLVRESLDAAASSQIEGLKKDVVDRAKKEVEGAVEQGKEALEGLFK